MTGKVLEIELCIKKGNPLKVTLYAFWFRLHFGMNGSMRINPLEKDLKGKPPALVVQLTTDAVCFFDTTVEIR